MSPKGPTIEIACALGMMIVQLVWAAGSVAHASADERQLAMEGLAGFETSAGTSLDGPTVQPRKSYNDALIRRIQQGLATQGFFLGPIDGQFGPKTESAIRAYQKSADLPVDGIPNEQLAIDLETGGKVGQLLNRLEKSRAATTGKAREALLSRPETRALIGDDTTGADAPHDLKACFAAPNPRCLLVEAAISARDIDKPEMRDWALGEILTSQAKAGLANDALATTRRIHDPRLIMVALGDIAKAQAGAGNTTDAMAAVDIIPDLTQQIEAYIAIAEIQADMGQIEEAAKTATHLGEYLNRIDAPLTKIAFHARIAVILHRASLEAPADENIRAAEKLVRALDDANERSEGLRNVAAAYAENGEPAKAMDVLKAVTNGSEDVPVLIAAATKLAQTGAAEEALVTAESIEAVRYRALVLARIASYQAGAGELDSARATLDKALEAAKQITFPFAKAYAFSRIALAFNDVGISSSNDPKLLDQALETAHLIKDDRLKAHIFWTIADERRHANDEPGAAKALKQATTATADIMSPFSRVWMLCDIAEERANNQDDDAAWSAFSEAFEEAKTITHPWGRARALSKVAGTMTALADRVSKTAAP